MDVSGIFWVVTIVMAVVACGFVAMPLFKNKRKVSLVAVAIVLPLLAGGLYLQLGSPSAAATLKGTIPSQDSTTDRPGTNGEKKLGSVASMVDGLASRLQENPDDGGDWLLLARSYKHLNRMDDAVEAYAHAARLGEFDAEFDALSGNNPDNKAPPSSVQIVGNVKLSPTARKLVLPSDTVFIFAKAENGPPAPLAVMQRPASELPFDFLLSDKQSMIAGMALSDYDKVIVTARITRGGDATVALQGLEARSDTILVADNRHVTLTIE